MYLPDLILTSKKQARLFNILRFPIRKFQQKGRLKIAYKILPKKLLTAHQIPKISVLIIFSILIYHKKYLQIEFDTTNYCKNQMNLHKVVATESQQISDKKKPYEINFILTCTTMKDCWKVRGVFYAKVNDTFSLSSIYYVRGARQFENVLVTNLEVLKNTVKLEYLEFVIVHTRSMCLAHKKIVEPIKVQISIYTIISSRFDARGRAGTNHGHQAPHPHPLGPSDQPESRTPAA